MRTPRIAFAGLVLAGTALLGIACGGVKNPEGWAGPVVNGPTVYYFADKDRLVAANVTPDGTAERLWEFPDDSKPEQKDIGFKAVYDGPAVDGDTLYFASWNEKAYAVGTDGTLQWEKENLEGGVVAGPIIAGDKLVFGTTQGTLYVLDKETGGPAPGWPENGLKLSSRGIWAPPVADGDTIYVATMAGEVHALDAANGNKLWAEPFKVDGAIADLGLLDGGRLFVPSLDKHVYIVDATTGTGIGEGFHTEDWVWTQAAQQGDTVYFGDFAGNVYALDITPTGLREKWAAPYDAGSKVKSAPVIVDDVLVVATRAPEIHFITLAEGQRKGNVVAIDTGTIRAPLTLDDKGRVFMVTTSGKLFTANAGDYSVRQVLVAGEKP